MIKIKHVKRQIIFFSLIIIIIITKFDIFCPLKTFKYGGLRLNIASICLFFFFSLLQFKIIKCNIIIKIIKQLSNYTGGVYFIHNLIGRGYIFTSLLLIDTTTIIGCIKIYIISYLICFIGAKICKNTRFRHLFS